TSAAPAPAGRRRARMAIAKNERNGIFMANQPPEALHTPSKSRPRRSDLVRAAFGTRVTFAFCRAACVAQRAEGVGQQRAVMRHPWFRTFQAALPSAPT